MKIFIFVIYIVFIRFKMRLIVQNYFLGRKRVFLTKQILLIMISFYIDKLYVRRYPKIFTSLF